MSREMGFQLLPVPEGIYSLDDARRAAAKLEGEGADFVLIQTSSFAAGEFIYPFTEISARLGIWAVPEGSPGPTGGLPLNSFTAANMYNSIIKTRISDNHKPVKWFFGQPADPLFYERLEITVQALQALHHIEDKRIGLIGGVAPGFDNLIVDEEILHSRLGIEVVAMDLDDLIARAEALTEQDIEDTARDIKHSATTFDPSLEQALEKTARGVQAVRQVVTEQDLSAVAISCWPQFQSDYNLAVCSMMGHLNSLGVVSACEGDVTSAVSMLALQGMSGGSIVTLMDLATVDPNDESILLWHCGPTAPQLADDRGVQMESLWLFDGKDGERIGLHNDLVLKPGPATVAGFNVAFDRVLVLEGRIDNTKPSYKGSRGWLKDLRINAQPISLNSLIESLMAAGFQHHFPFTFGLYGLAFLELGSWLDISPLPVKPYTLYMS
ncbi:MAG: hypothetical protein R6U57_01350 [Anaerolineales bacterium]